MDVILWIVFGLIVGVVARLLVPGRHPTGILSATLVGVAGALIGGWIGTAIGLYAERDAAGFFLSVVGAAVFVLAYRLFAPSWLRS